MHRQVKDVAVEPLGGIEILDEEGDGADALDPLTGTRPVPIPRPWPILPQCIARERS
jgi:hypothetical protein